MPPCNVFVAYALEGSVCYIHNSNKKHGLFIYGVIRDAVSRKIRGTYEFSVTIMVVNMSGSKLILIGNVHRLRIFLFTHFLLLIWRLLLLYGKELT